MTVAPFQQSPSSAMLVEDGKVVGHVSLGGDFLLMPVGDKTILFEQHRYFGPWPLNKTTQDPMTRVPKGFWDAIDRWRLGGQLVDGDLCVVSEWCESCGGTGQERLIVGRLIQSTGPCKSCNGARLAQESVNTNGKGGNQSDA